MKYKRFVLFLVICVVSIYLVRSSFVSLTSKYFFERSVIYDRGQWVKEDGLKPKVVFLGSSMTRHSIIPEIIINNLELNSGEVVNLGMNAATPYEMYLTYRKNIHSFNNAELFIYNLDPWIFSKRYYRHKKFEKILWSLNEWKKYSFDPDVKDFVSYKNNLLDESRKSTKYRRPIFKDYGYAPLECNAEFKLATKQEVVDYFHDILDDGSLAISDFQISYLSRLKKQVESSGAQFLILLVPNHESYTENIANYNNKYNQLLENKINLKLGNVKHIGTFCPGDFNLIGTTDFYDRHHLCHEGAIKYSNFIGNVLTNVNAVDNTSIKLDYGCE